MAIYFSEKEYKELSGESPRRKYNNTKVEVDGITFDSEKEAERYSELVLLQRAGEISDLQLQPSFVVIPAVVEQGIVVQRAVKYRADFSYMKNGRLMVEDVKGVKTEVYKLKKKLMRYRYGIVVREI